MSATTSHQPAESSTPAADEPEVVHITEAIAATGEHIPSTWI